MQLHESFWSTRTYPEHPTAPGDKALQMALWDYRNEHAGFLRLSQALRFSSTGLVITLVLAPPLAVLLWLIEGDRWRRTEQFPLLIIGAVVAVLGYLASLWVRRSRAGARLHARKSDLDHLGYSVCCNHHGDLAIIPTTAVGADHHRAFPRGALPIDDDTYELIFRGYISAAGFDGALARAAERQRRRRPR